MECPEQPPQLSDLPDVVLEVAFGFCADRETVPIICLVCQRWRSVYQHSSIPLPLLSLKAPVNEQWVQQHAKKLKKVSRSTSRLLLLLLLLLSYRAAPAAAVLLCSCLSRLPDAIFALFCPFSACS